MSGQHFFHQRHESRSADFVSITWARRIALAAAAVLFVAPGAAQAQSFWNWGASDYSEPRPAPPKRVKAKRKVDPAEKIARNSPKPVGPLVIAISIAKQRVKVYDSNGLFAEAPVSTGTKTHPTPMGVFSIIQKNKHHVSNLYNASMPYMQRITWSGVALHTGPLPGYAASHGCIRLPNEFATRLWTWTKMGTRVIVAPDDISPSDIAHPKLIARMMPSQAVSAQTETPAAPAKLASRRTADASSTIASMTGTLSDADPSPAAKEAAPEVEKTAEKTAEKEVVKTAAPAIAAEMPAATEPAITEKPAAADAPAIPARTPAIAQEKPASADSAAVTEAAPSATAEAKASPETAADRLEKKTAEQAPPAVAASSTQVEAPAPRPAEIAAPEAKPAEAAKSDVAAPAAAPEATKPAVTAAAPKRSQSHVAVFISRKDQKLYVRQGYEPVFDVPVQIADVERPLGTHVFTARGNADDQSALQWSVVSLPQVRRTERNTRQKTKSTTAVHSAIVPALNASEALDRVSIPADALEKIAAIISPGGSLLISDHGLNGWETGKGTDFIVPLR